MFIIKTERGFPPQKRQLYVTFSFSNVYDISTEKRSRLGVLGFLDKNIMVYPCNFRGDG